jgi:hypothetical protein
MEKFKIITLSLLGLTMVKCLFYDITSRNELKSLLLILLEF